MIVVSGRTKVTAGVYGTAPGGMLREIVLVSRSPEVRVRNLPLFLEEEPRMLVIVKSAE